MSSLTTPHRKLLETAVKHARKIATAGARKSLEALAVHEPDPYPHMDAAQRAHRRKLLAQAKQLGDGESPTKRGSYEIAHLVEKLAYDQWHRILFARYLLENKLLISPLHSTPGNPVDVSLDDCEELAPSQGLKDAWAVAARFAAVELPEIFRADDPAGAVELPVEDRKPLIALVTGLPVEVFTAGDSLGWCYQFWQADKKIESNASGNKIGADELPSVTQLFTEDYMVDFLLDNTLGAWWAGKQVSSDQSSVISEEDARKAVALPGCEWKYLRFVKDEPKEEPSDPSETPLLTMDERHGGTDSNSKSPSNHCSLGTRWRPAAGTFSGWPTTAADLKCLDPCMGSGHFVVAMFERLVTLRMAEENLSEAEAVAAVIRDNLFGLEIDPRCTQIAAFNLALAAWRRVGHCKLPAMNLACSGLAPNTREADWMAIAGDNQKLQRGMERLYRLFQKAAVLGSLINPRAGESDLLVAAFHELQPLLEKALAQETKDDISHEMAVTARGLAKAAEILAGQFTLVATNVPYLGRGKQVDVLKEYCKRAHSKAKADLATCFVERSLEFCQPSGSIALVTPQNWWFLSSYADYRRLVLEEETFHLLATLGEEAWQSFGDRGPMAALIAASRIRANAKQTVCAIDALPLKLIDSKINELLTGEPIVIGQEELRANPDSRLAFDSIDTSKLLANTCESWQGLVTSDNPRFMLTFWEVWGKGWETYISSPTKTRLYGGRENVIYWMNGSGPLHSDGKAHNFPPPSALGRKGILLSQVRSLSATIYTGETFANGSSPVIPADEKTLPALWCFISTAEYQSAVRNVDKKTMVTNGSLLKVEFDLAHWQKVAAEKYPHGLPKPFSSDPTQWLFNGHPAGADQPLHVAVARLLGYQWPRQTGSSFPDCPALDPDGLEHFADEDGIVCLSATKGEAPAAERLRALLAQALGKLDLPALIAGAGIKASKSETLDDWLRDEFFEQHCALFDNRPFIWHLWDGHKSGFSALVNYHQLTHAKLENLTYAYLGDWIRRQQAAVEAEEAGSDAKLQAAKALQTRLKLILEGEPPYDLFVRWKPLSKQAIGWHPDLNDGVRMNIRPFLATDIPGGKKGAGLLRTKPNIKWEKDRGKEPQRDKAEFPWFWKGSTFTGDRVNDVHLTKAQKEATR
ncbi:MAG: restriction endonuclease subunit M [Verrucomicrobiia bacterium Tous-C4TDCM]|nr:MAG: restriction endonuclease subunit M [Verrucomicrobiae bacterium Tous-C4TDCM]